MTGQKSKYLPQQIFALSKPAKFYFAFFTKKVAVNETLELNL